MEQSLFIAFINNRISGLFLTNSLISISYVKFVSLLPIYLRVWIVYFIDYDVILY